MSAPALKRFRLSMSDTTVYTIDVFATSEEEAIDAGYELGGYDSANPQFKICDGEYPAYVAAEEVLP
jgi:hypothetical protein